MTRNYGFTSISSGLVDDTQRQMSPPRILKSYSLGLVLLLVPSCWGVETPVWWSRAIASLPSVCVLDNTCHQDSRDTLDTDYTRHVNTRQTPCCTGCSCHPTCSLDGNCCFPSQHEYPDRSRQKCIYPINQTPRFRHLYKAYYMYVDCDPTYPDSKLSDMTETDMGPLQPVSSKMTGRLYYNRAIAECNRVNDATDWVLNVQCKHSLFGVLDLSNISSFLNNNACRSGFTYPGTASDIRTEECFDDLMQSCAPLFNIPPGINMTADEVVEACTSGLVSPFLPQRNESSYIYANVFCFICDLGSFNYADGMCPLSEMYNFRKLTDKRLFTLVFGQPNQLKGFDGKQKVEACSRRHDPSEPAESCRSVYCPTGQRLLTSGKCGFVFDTFEFSQLVIFLKLSAVPVPGQNLPILQDIYLDNLTNINNPWLDSNWTLQHMYCEATVPELETCSVDYIVVVLEHSKASVEPRPFFDGIQVLLRKYWLWGVNGREVRYGQSLHRQTTFHPIGFNEAARIYTSPDPSVTRSNMSEIDTAYIRKEVASSVFPITQSMKLTKLFYCPQVELNSDEFVPLSEYSLIQVKATNTVLFSGEYASNFDKVRLCLSDSGLGITKASANGLGPDYMVLFECVCTWLILVNSFTAE